jgi:hypothetical protein
MSAITIAGLSASDAEEVLVQVWLLLEKYDIVSPEMTVKPLSEHPQIWHRFSYQSKVECGVEGKRSSDQRAAFDPSLRERVVGRIEPFVDALDAAVVNPEPETIEDLQEAADELMRAIARVILELARSSDLR